jgi:hypothetical protein
MCDKPTERAMPERPNKLLGRPTQLDRFALRPGNFTESPEN